MTARKHVRILLAAALASTGLLAATAPSAHAAGGMEVAIQDEPVFTQTGRYFDRARALTLARQMNVTRLRVNVQWSKVVQGANQRTAPRQPVYNWAVYDQLIDLAAAQGIRLEMSLTGPAPAWAQGNRRLNRTTIRPNASLYGQFARDAATHFRGRVDTYLIWNEPNLKAWLSPVRSAPRLYRSLMTAGIPAIKGADSSAKVLIGVVAPFARNRRNATNPLVFMRRALCVDDDYRPRGRCPAITADGFANHPYDFVRPIGSPSRKWPFRGCRNECRLNAPEDVTTLGMLINLRRALAAFRRARRLRGGATRNIYLTEYGYYAKGAFRVADSRRAKFLKDAFRLANRTPGVRQLLQYTLIQPPGNFPGSFFDLSIVNRNGSTERPYRSVQAWSRGARIKKPRPFTPPPVRTP
jgi:hypothetical protein